MNTNKLDDRSCDQMVLLVGGDFCPARGFADIIKNTSAESLFDEAFFHFKEADCSIVNLECPLTLSDHKAVKTGSCLRAKPESIRILSEAAITACNVANNHIMDYGPSGLKDTLRTCHDAGIKTFGAGATLDAAQKPFIYKAKGIQVGVVSCAEHEWSIARSDYPGANPLNMPETLWQIRELREQVDFLLVLVHGGREHYPLPYPQLQKWCRYMVKEGADAVICQHSHCIGGWERFGNGVIGYGQGNLLFDRGRKISEAWHEGVLAKFTISRRGDWKDDLIPYRQSVDYPGIRLMTESEKLQLFRRMDDWLTVLADPAKLETAWREHCLSNEGTYLGVLAGGGRYLRFLLNRLPWLRRWYSHGKRRLLLNVLRCQTHYEMVRTILETKVTDGGSHKR